MGALAPSSPATSDPLPRPRLSTFLRLLAPRSLPCFVLFACYFDFMSAEELITVNSNILGGTPVFKGTRVPVRALFEYLERGYTLEEFIECFPSVTKDLACRVLERSEAALLAA